MISRTDDGSYDVKKLIVVEPMDQKRKYKSVLSHVEIPLPENPMRYTTCPNVDPEKGLWPATGINAANVGMTATFRAAESALNISARWRRVMRRFSSTEGPQLASTSARAIKR